MARTSTQTKFTSAQDAIRQAKAGTGFTKAPSATKGASSKGEYGTGNLVKAKTGPLSRRMGELFARDTQLDAGVERVERKQSINERLEMVKGRLKEGQKAIVTKSGAVQVRDQRGRIVSTPLPAVRGKGGQFRKATPKDFTVQETRVTDSAAFKAQAENRAEALGTSLFGGDNYTAARRVAVLSGLEQDRKDRGWKEVPDLV